MPVACPRCGKDVVIGSLRCKACGADARKATGPPRLSFSDAIGHDIEAWAEARFGKGFVRRNKIVDRLQEISPEYVLWLRQPEETRGEAPPLDYDQQLEADTLMKEYTSLLPPMD